MIVEIIIQFLVSDISQNIPYLFTESLTMTIMPIYQALTSSIVSFPRIPHRWPELEMPPVLGADMQIVYRFPWRERIFIESAYTLGVFLREKCGKLLLTPLFTCLVPSPSPSSLHKAAYPNSSSILSQVLTTLS